MPDIPGADKSNELSFDLTPKKPSLPDDLSFDLSDAKPPELSNEMSFDLGTPAPKTRPRPSLSAVDWNTLEQWKYSPASDPGVPTKEAEDDLKATLAVSALTGMDIQSIQGNLTPISETLYGERLSAPGIFKRIKNTWEYGELNHQRNRIGMKMALGLDTPEIKQELESVTQKMPNADEMLPTIPQAVLNFIHETFRSAKIITGGEKGLLPTEDLGENIRKNAIVTTALSIMNPKGGMIFGPAEYVKDMTEQSIGSTYLAVLEGGGDPTTARITASAVAAVDIVLNSLPMLQAMGSGAKVAKQLGQQAVVRGIIRGVFKPVAKQLLVQGAYGYGQAAVHTLGPEIAKFLSEKVTGGECTFKDAQQILAEIGLEGTFNTLPDLVAAGASMGSSLIRMKKGAALDLALKAELRKMEIAEAEAKAVKTEGSTKVPEGLPDPLKQKLDKIIAMTDAELDTLDTQVRSAESSADYISEKDMTFKQGVQEGRAQVEGKQLLNKYVKDIREAGKTKLLPEFQGPIDEIMDLFTPEHFRADTVVKLNALREGLAEMDSPDISEAMMAKLGELDKVSLEDMAVEDVKTIRDAVLQYKHLAAESEKIRVAGIALNRAAVVRAAINDLPLQRGKQKAVTVEAKPGETVTAPKEIIAGPDVGKKISNVLKTIKNTATNKQIHYMDLLDRLGTTSKKVFGSALDEGYRGDLRDMQAVNAEFKQRTAAIPNQGPWLDEIVSIEINNAQTATLSRAHQLSLYMHAKNPQNRAHLTGDDTSGFALTLDKYARHKIFKVTDAALDKLVKAVEADPQAKLYVDTVSDMLSRMGKKQAEVYARLNGIPLELVENYYHIETVPMQRKSNTAERVALLKEQMGSVTVGPATGHLKERTGSKIALVLNPITHDFAVSRDLYAAYSNLAEPTRNALRLLRDPEYARALADIEPDLQRNITKALKDINHQHDPIPSFEQLSLKIRNNMGLGILAFPNTWPVIKQIIAMPRYGMYVDPVHLTQGVVESTLHFKTTRAFLEEGSPGFTDRIEGGQSREIADILRQAKGSEIGGRLGWRQKLMAPMRWQDAGVVQAGMIGAYNKVMDELQAGNLSPIVKKVFSEEFGLGPKEIAAFTPDDHNKWAMRYADFTTEKTQVMPSPLYQSDWQRGSPFQKATTLFMSENIASLNMVRRELAEAIKKGTPRQWARVAAAATIVFGSEQLANMAVNRTRRAATGVEQPDLKKELLATLINAPFQGAPVVGAVEQAVVNKVVMGWDADNFSLMPMENAINLVIQLGVDVSAVAMLPPGYKRQKAAGRAADALGQVLGMATGFPYVPLRTNAKMGIHLTKAEPGGFVKGALGVK